MYRPHSNRIRTHLQYAFSSNFTFCEIYQNRQKSIKIRIQFAFLAPKKKYYFWIKWITFKKKMSAKWVHTGFNEFRITFKKTCYFNINKLTRYRFQ